MGFTNHCSIENYNSNYLTHQTVGVIELKHVAIECPSISGSGYFNYKPFFSFLLFALFHADHNLMFVDVESCEVEFLMVWFSKNFQRYDNIEKGSTKLPPTSPLPTKNILISYVILGADAFAWSDSLMKPYSSYHPKGSPERIDIYRGRRVVENTFDISASVFHVLR